MTLLKIHLCQHCASKLDTVDKTQGSDAMAEIVANTLRACRKCSAQLPRHLRSKPFTTKLKEHPMSPRPIPGSVAIEYRKGSLRCQRCSRCHREQQQSSLVLDTLRANSLALAPVMVGQDLIGMVCADCVHAVERHIQSVFPDGHAFPFVDAAQQLLPTPRCKCGTALVWTDDGRGMACTQCDVERQHDSEATPA